MLLSEDQIVNIIYDAVKTKGDEEWWCQAAACAIAQAQREGVVWEAECDAYPTRSGKSIGLEFVTRVERVGTVYLPRFESEITKRHRVCVIMTAKNALQTESKAPEADKEEEDARETTV